MLAVGLVEGLELVFVDLDAEPRLLDAPPLGAIRDRQGSGQDIAFQILCGLLMPVASIRCGEHHVLAGGGQAELTVGMLAELPPLQMRDPCQVEKTAERADPVGEEAGPAQLC